MDTNFLILSAAILATTKTLKIASPQISGIVTVFVAVALGALAGWQHVAGVPDIATGILAGLASVAASTVADKAGGKE